MKQKTNGIYLLMLGMLVLMLANCANLNMDFRKLDTMDKKYQFAQEEWIDALQQYRDFMVVQTPEMRVTLHEKYDKAIKDVDLALDLWGATLTDTTEYNNFLEAKNKLLRLGFAKFYKGGDK